MPLFRRRSQLRSAGSAPTEPRASGSVSRNLPGAVASNRYRIGALADRQRGLATWAQLRRRGIAKAVINRAVAADRLHRVFPSVYSVVAPSLMTADAWHAAAVLAGGTDARLCADSAAWWANVLQRQPGVIHVGVRSERRPVEGIQWHRIQPVDDDRIQIRHMPLTRLERIPLELASSMTEWDLRGVLAELEFHHAIGPDQVRPTLRRGVPGAAKLRRAIDRHTPELAATRSELERALAQFLDVRRFRLPAFNYPVGRSTVDAVYAEQGLVIELDGVAGHSGERRILRDHRRDLHRRADGLVPLRYHYAQIMDPHDGVLIEAELERWGVPRV